MPFTVDYEINSFTTDSLGYYSGQSTGLVKQLDAPATVYKHVLLKDY
jgi:hypothetical protein